MRDDFKNEVTTAGAVEFTDRDSRIPSRTGNASVFFMSTALRIGRFFFSLSLSFEFRADKMPPRMIRRGHRSGNGISYGAE